MRMNLDDVVFDEAIYPRQNISHKTVESYVEALKAGARFPPLEVQKVRKDRKVHRVLLDGMHAW